MLSLICQLFANFFHWMYCLCVCCLAFNDLLIVLDLELMQDSPGGVLVLIRVSMHINLYLVRV